MTVAAASGLFVLSDGRSRPSHLRQSLMGDRRLVGRGPQSEELHRAAVGSRPLLPLLFPLTSCPRCSRYRHVVDGKRTRAGGCRFGLRAAFAARLEPILQVQDGPKEERSVSPMLGKFFQV
jgi:hypothetical protein